MRDIDSPDHASREPKMRYLRLISPTLSYSRLIYIQKAALIGDRIASYSYGGPARLTFRGSRSVVPKDRRSSRSISRSTFFLYLLESKDD